MSAFNLPNGVLLKDISPKEEFVCEECGEPLEGDFEIRMGVCRECCAEEAQEENL